VPISLFTQRDCAAWRLRTSIADCDLESVPFTAAFTASMNSWNVACTAERTTPARVITTIGFEKRLGDANPLHFVAVSSLARTAGMLAHSGRRLSFRASVESVEKDHVVDIELDGADVGRRADHARVS